MTSADREFLSALSDVVFGNPYSRERAALIVRLAPGARLGDLTENRDHFLAILGLLMCIHALCLLLLYGITHTILVKIIAHRTYLSGIVLLKLLPVICHVTPSYPV